MKETVAKLEFPLAPAQRWLVPMLFGLWVALMVAACLGSSHQQAATNPVPWWLVIPFATALFPVGLYVTLAHRRIAIEGEWLVVVAGLILARRVRISDMALDAARILSLDEHTEFKPMLRLVAFSLPGYKAGHYLLHNRARAFCLLTSTTGVLLLPLHDGKFIVLSPERPQALLEALRAEPGAATLR
ncbi:MAG: PH domain-containing protein [Arenimonas sp.]